MLRLANELLLELAPAFWCRSAVTLPTLSPAAPAEEKTADPEFMMPNGKRLSDAPPKQAKRTGAGGVG